MRIVVHERTHLLFDALVTCYQVFLEQTSVIEAVDGERVVNQRHRFLFLAGLSE